MTVTVQSKTWVYDRLHLHPKVRGKILRTLRNNFSDKPSPN